ncbi:MAG: hypothetical protein R3B70_28520 [Polyangiaceae bacterium]
MFPLVDALCLPIVVTPASTSIVEVLAADTVPGPTSSAIGPVNDGFACGVT